MKKRICMIAFVLIAATSIYPQQAEFPRLTGPYLGQKPPGMTPEIFAPGIVSDENRVYANVTFNPELAEVAWTLNTSDTTLNHGGIIISKFENGSWSMPKEVRFLSKEYDHRSPFYSLDGKRLYFQAYLRSNRGWDQMEKFYFVEKTDAGWSNPVLLDSLFNRYAVHWQFSLDKQNNLFFGGDLRGKENTGGIYFSKFDNGKYQEPFLLFENRILDEAVFGPGISPNGDYIIFARIHPRGSTNPRIFSLYISFRKGVNNWTPPRELGEKLGMDCNQPRIGPDGKYIFYVTNEGLSYWVSAKIIEE